MQQRLNEHHIVQALTAIHLPGATPQQINIATQYLSSCEGNPQLPLTLLKIHCQSDSSMTQTTSLLLLINVIKRNWHLKPHTKGANGCAYTQQTKTAFRGAVVAAYGVHHMQYHKHYNQLIKAIAKRDYPQGYPELHQLITEQLESLLHHLQNHSNDSLPPATIRVLATSKAVMKQFNAKKMSHNQNTFNQFISRVIESSRRIAPVLHARIRSQSAESMPVLIECLRKADKITLYGLGTMPTKLQYSSEVGGVLREVIGRVAEMDGMIQGLGQAWKEGEKYISMVLQQVARIQNSYPFLLSQYLRDYLMLLLRLMLNRIPQSPCYKGQRITCSIISAGFKPLVSFAYYMNQQQFKGSIYCRRQPNAQDNQLLQNNCHMQYMGVYSEEAIGEILRGMLMKVMTAQHVVESQRQIGDEMVFEDVEVVVGDGITQATPYQMCTTYLKHFLKCFKPTVLPLFKNMLRQLLNTTLDSPQKIQILRNMIEVMMMLPYQCDEEQLPLDLLQSTLSLLHQHRQYMLLARITRKYFEHMNQSTISGCLKLMAQIVSSPPQSIPAHVLYQAALTLKAVLRSMEGELPADVVVPCMKNIVSLIPLPQFSKNPNLLWPLINLLIKLVRLVDENSPVLSQQINFILTQGLQSLIHFNRNQQLTIGALAELLSTLLYTSLGCIKKKYKPRPHPLENIELGQYTWAVSEACYWLVLNNLDNPALQNYDTILRLWLTAIRSYPTLYQQQTYQCQLDNLNKLWLELYHSRREDLAQQDALIFVELTEQYFICQLLPINATDIPIITEQVLTIDAGQNRMRRVMALTSLTHSFWSITQTLPDILPTLMRELINISDTVSPASNAVRTELFFLIQNIILDQPSPQVYGFFTQQSGGDPLNWFLPFLKSMRFVCHKFAYKLNSSALLKAAKEIGVEQFGQLLVKEREGEMALDSILKVIGVEIGPSRLDFVPNSYDHIVRTLLKTELYPQFTANHYRKTTLHLTCDRIAEVAKADLTDLLRQVFLPILGQMGWNSNTLSQRLGSSTSKGLCTALGWSQPSQQ